MKKLLLLVGAVLFSASLYAYDFKLVSGSVIFAKWKATSNGVDYVAYSNAERNVFISASPSSAPLTVGDFADISPTVAQTIAANAIEPAFTGESVTVQLDKLKTKAGVIDLCDIYEDKIARLQRLSSRYGFDVSAATTTLQLKIDAIRAAYSGAQ